MNNFCETCMWFLKAVFSWSHSISEPFFIPYLYFHCCPLIQSSLLHLPRDMKLRFCSTPTLKTSHVMCLILSLFHSSPTILTRDETMSHMNMVHLNICRRDCCNLFCPLCLGYMTVTWEKVFPIGPPSVHIIITWWRSRLIPQSTFPNCLCRASKLRKLQNEWSYLVCWLCFWSWNQVYVHWVLMYCICAGCCCHKGDRRS